MKRKVFYILLTAALVFFLVSCGIPSIYVPSSSDITITAEDDGKFTIKISDTTRTELSSSSPSLYFFYTISSSEQNSSYSSLLSSFNSKYAEETNGRNISSTFTDNQPFLGYTSGDNTYGLYQFSNLVMIDISGISEDTFVLKLDESGYLNLSYYTNDGDIAIKEKITRFNYKTFDISSSHDEVVEYTAAGIYDLKVYALVSCQFNDYSNTYNTKLSSSAVVYNVNLQGGGQ